MHTSIICVRDNSIIALETFPFGSEMLMRLLEVQYSELTLLQIEHMLSNNEYDTLTSESVSDFFEYLMDTIRVYIKENTQAFNMGYMVCHGGIFDSTGIRDILAQKVRDEYGSKTKILTFSDIMDCESDQVVTSGLADIATELLMVKKDPLVRILRYVLYNYE